MAKVIYYTRAAGLNVLLFMISCTFTNAFVNNKIDRIIDLSSQVVKITERIHIDKLGSNTYKILMDSSHRGRLAYIDVSASGQSLPIVSNTDGSFDVDMTNINPKPLIVTTVYTKILQPFPAEIAQGDRQFVKYYGFQTTLSPYLTKSITTKIKLPQGSRLESFTKASKMTTGTNKLTYGPFKDIQANQAETFSIHFENNNPFVAVTHLMRTLEVSPWAQSINIVNQVKVLHVGAKLKGPFSRIDYQRDHSNGISSVRSFSAELPKSARDIYFRDGIGNISTSSVRYSPSKTMLNIKPRFPLFGGWATDFTLGYRVPIGEFLFEPSSNGKYRLSIPFSDVFYENMFIEDSEVHIILPAGASDIEVEASAIDFERQQDDKIYSYLDVIGRPVVILKKKNVVIQHVENMRVFIKYNYSKIYMAQEILLLSASVISILLLMALYSKLTHPNRGFTSAVVAKHKAD